MITLGTEVKRLLPQGSGEAGFLPPGPMITLPKIAEGQRGDEEWTLDKRHNSKKQKKQTLSAVPSDGIQWKTHVYASLSPVFPPPHQKLHHFCTGWQLASAVT